MGPTQILCQSLLITLTPAISNVVAARDILFPPVSPMEQQYAMIMQDDMDIRTGSAFAGLLTYANVPYVHCLAPEGQEVEKYDIAILGAPFDTYAFHCRKDSDILLRLPPRLVFGVQDKPYETQHRRLQHEGNIYKTEVTFLQGTTGRPGARFGPSGIRRGSRRIEPEVAWNIETGKNVFLDWAKIVDCGDAPLTFLDNTLALKQLDMAHKIVSGRPTNSTEYHAPRVITLGGDHTTTLSALRSVHKRWGQVSVIHFDSHIDTWDPKVLGGGISHYGGVNHGTFLHIAHEEGLIRNTSIHAGIRAPVNRPKKDVRNDRRCGFDTISARDIDRIGVHGIIERLKQRVGESPVYVSVDIDVLDPAFAPATGTAEVGGWTSREFLSIIDGLSGLQIVGADVVEVAPIYDNPGETTVLVAAEVVQSLIGLMVHREES